MAPIRVLEYVDTDGRSPYGKWFASLNAEAAAKVAVALYRLREGNLSNLKGVGSGVFERKIDFGPGYRVYLGRDGDTLVVLARGREQAAAGAGHRGRQGAVGGLQDAQEAALRS